MNFFFQNATPFSFTQTAPDVFRLKHSIVFKTYIHIYIYFFTASWYDKRCYFLASPCVVFKNVLKTFLVLYLHVTP